MIKIGLDFQTEDKSETCSIIYASITENKAVVEAIKLINGETWTTERKYTLNELSELFKKGVFNYLTPQ